MNRAQRRAAKKNKKNKNKDVQEKIGLFNKLPDECLVCCKAFDKPNKEMVASWNVVVREKSQIVRLYCPDCWQKAKEILESIKSENSDNRKTRDL